jgi:protein O-mannosyl-transferase
MVKPALPISWNRDWVWGLLIVAATFLAYLPAWNGKPVWDDNAHMTKPELRSTAGLARIWTQPGAVPQYYPLVHTIFWVEHRLFGDATPGYHLLTILLHALSSLLLVTILRRLGLSGTAAWLAGGIFALHPVMVESVAWITELKNTLSGVFFLCAGLAYLKFDHGREIKHYTVALILFLLGLLAKSVIVTLPAALLVVFWWKRGSIGWKRDVAPLVPFFVIGIISGLFTVLVERRIVGAEGGEYNLSFIVRCLIAGRAVWFYLYKLLWPANLIFIYPRWHIDALTMQHYLFPAAFMLAAVLFWKLRSRSRAPMATLLYFTITLFPALGFFNLYFFHYSFVSDHFQYLASIGPIAAAAAVIVQGTGVVKEGLRRPTQLLLCGMVLAVLFLLSWRQSGTYSDAETLYQITIQKNTQCWMAHNNLGVLFTDMGRTDEAMAHYQKALEINPDNDEAHDNLGVLLAHIGRTDEAIAHFLKTLEINPNHSDAHYNLGNLLVQIGRTDEAIAHYRKALEINPDDMGALQNLAFVLVQNGQWADATSVLQGALASARSAGNEARIKMIEQILKQP